jgi:hypothetical protein
MYRNDVQEMKYTKFIKLQMTLAVFDVEKSIARSDP